MASSKAPILAKGQSCSSCKARKVRCDAVRPACTACRRSAKFRGDDPDAVCCSYSSEKRCATTAAGKSVGAKRAKTARTSRKGSVEVKQVDVVDVVEQIQQLLPTQPALPTLPFPPSSTFASTSTFPLPEPPLSDAPAYLDLPAPVAVAPAAYPAFLPPPSLPFDFDFPVVSSNFAAFSTFDSTAPAPPPQPYPSTFALPPYTASPETFTLSSPSSYSSFSFSDSSFSASSSSSGTGSPFSLCEDLDLAFASSSCTSSSRSSPPPLFLPPQQPEPYPAAAAAYPFSTAFLPGSHDADETLALPLFRDREFLPLF
ncbi:hypothetical protein JCM8547_005706 [Rhodosporidiobolus lusitaniae]